MSNFIKFLKSDEKVFVVGNEKEKKICVKIPYFIEGWESLYSGHTYDYYEKELKMNGFYNPKEQKIYAPSWYLKYDMGEEVVNGISYDGEQIETELREKVLAKLEEKYQKKDYATPKKESMEKYNYRLTYGVETRARSMFLCGEEEVGYDFELKFSINNILKFILNKEKEVQEFADKYFSDEEHVASYICMKSYIKETYKKLEEMKAEAKENGLEKLKNIRNAMLPDIKTVTVTILKDGKTFSCKVSANRIKYFESLNDWISSWDISPVKDREKFYELFGKHSDIRVKDIIKIEYNRKTLYEEEV